MNRFVQRALDRIDRLDREAIRNLITDLANQNELADMVMESMRDAIVVLDTSSRVLMLNKSTSRLIPLTTAEALDRVIWEVIEDQDVAQFVRHHLERQERVLGADFTMDRGAARTISLTILPLVRNGTIQGSLISVEDVTDKRNSEARLRRAEGLAALTTLTAGVAHEIKNPLASIGIHLQLMQKLLAGQETVETGDLEQYLGIVGEEVDRLNMIVVDYLTAVRPSDIDLLPGDLNEVVRDVMEFLRFEVSEADVELVTKFAKAPRVLLDEKSLKQALLNLVKNAMSAMPDGGRLTVTTEITPGGLQLIVRDTGHGIPEGMMGKIFEPYFTTGESSSGLGLTVVYKIIKEHRGEISVSSRIGEGTQFALTFPIPQAEKHLIGYQGDE